MLLLMKKQKNVTMKSRAQVDKLKHNSRTSSTGQMKRHYREI